MRQLVDYEIKLCQTCGKIFEESIDKINISSPLFIKRFMQSNIAKKFDNLSFSISSFDYLDVLDEFKNKYQEVDKGKKYLPEEMYWIGYIYRAICVLYNFSSKYVFSLISGTTLRRYYFIYHTFDISYAAERIMESLNINISKNTERYYDIYKNIIFKERNKVNKDTIETNRLLLRHFNIDDAQQMFTNWASDKEVTKFMTWSPHSNVNETKQIISTWVKEYKKKTTHRFAITLKKSDELIGSIDVVSYVDGSPEIGYCLSRKYWNQGLMSEACKAFINYLFYKGYKQIVIEADVNNIASNRVIEKCGFTFTHQEEKEHCSIFKPEPVVVNWYKLVK